MGWVRVCMEGRQSVGLRMRESVGYRAKGGVRAWVRGVG